MKTAICFSGQPRHLERCIASIKQNIIDPNDADVFFHFWACHPKETHFWSHNEDVQWDVLSLDRIKDLLRPVNFAFEEQIEFDVSAFTETTCPTYNLWSWTYSSQMCHTLYDPAEYDAVIHCRPDLFFRKSHKLEIANDKSFHVEYRGTSGDQFAYGTTDVMQSFSKLHDNLPALYKEIGHVNAETMLATHMKNCGYSTLPANVQYTLWRQEHEH